MQVASVPYNKIGVQLDESRDTSNELVFPLPTLLYIALHAQTISSIFNLACQ